MRNPDAWLCRLLVCSSFAIAFAASLTSHSATTVPPQLRELVDQRIVVGIDTATSQPRLVAGERFKRAPRMMQVRAKTLARLHVRAARPDATEIVVVDAAGKVIETIAIGP